MSLVAIPRGGVVHLACHHAAPHGMQAAVNHVIAIPFAIAVGEGEILERGDRHVSTSSSVTQLSSMSSALDS